MHRISDSPRLKRLENIANACSAAEPVYFVDEVDIDLNPRIGRDWMWQAPNRRGDSRFMGS